MNNTFKK